MSEGNLENPLAFHGRGGTLFGIQIQNLFLILITLGIYSFWGRVRVRQYLWGQFEFSGDRLSYHGTGGETLRGWIKAALIFGIPYVLISRGPRWMGMSPVLIGAGVLLSVLLIVLFIPMATVGSRRYRLSRTAWRGIRLAFRKTWKDYLPIFWKGNFLSLITLGFYSPYYEMTREKFLVSNTYAGNRHFSFDGKGKELFGSYVKAVLLAIPTLMFSLYWFHVVKRRYIWNHTSFGDARFNCTITFGGMLGLTLGNLLLLLVTLGFAFSWTQVRSINYWVANLALRGEAELNDLEQKSQTVNATGEELASFLELDLDLG